MDEAARQAELARLERMAALPGPAQPKLVARHNLLGRVSVAAGPQGILLSLLVGDVQLEAYDFFMPPEMCAEVEAMLAQARQEYQNNQRPPGVAGVG